MDGKESRREGEGGRWLDGLIDSWMDARMEGWMDTWIHRFTGKVHRE